MAAPVVQIDQMLGHPTYKTISARMKFIGINLEDFIDFDYAGKGPLSMPFGLLVHKTLVEGIAFRVKQVPHGEQAMGTSLKDLVAKLRSATSGGQAVFREGKVPDRPNAPFDASMGATTGMGFREIMYLPASGIGMGGQRNTLGNLAPSLNVSVSSAFGKTHPKLDISSLHLAVWGNYCTIHIDQAGFTIGAMPSLSGGDVFLSPDMFQHIWVELFQRDVLGIPEAFEFYVPNSTNDYSKFGIKLEHTFKGDAKIELNISYDVTEGFQGAKGLAGTIGFSKSF